MAKQKIFSEGLLDAIQAGRFTKCAGCKCLFMGKEYHLDGDSYCQRCWLEKGDK